MPEPAFDKLAILGVGLIGGSLGLAVRERGLARQVCAYSRTPATRERAVARGAADTAAASPEACVEGADLVYLATPAAPSAPPRAAPGPYLKPGCLLTDAGSTKAAIVREVAELGLPGTFVGGHPMAGSEEAGVDAARADLFCGMSYVLTPTVDTPAEAVERLAVLAAALGARVCFTSPELHDQAVAVSSHLPHLMAWALMLVTQRRHEAGEPVYEVTAGSWADATRVAGSTASLWREILVSNRQAVLAALAEGRAALAELQRALADDPDELESLLAACRTWKREHPGKP